MPWWQRRKFMPRNSRSTFCCLEDLMVSSRIWISLFYSSDLKTDFNNTVQAVPVFYCEAVKPADKGKTQETFNKRLIKLTEDDWTDRKEVEKFVEKANSPFPHCTIASNLRWSSKNSTQTLIIMHDALFCSISKINTSKKLLSHLE